MMTRAAFLLVLLWCSAPAQACRGPFPPLETSVQRAAAIFLGTVVEVRQDGKGSVAMVFTVDEALKGTFGKTVEVQGDTTTCGFGAFLQKGDRLLMFAFGSPLRTSATAPNKSLSQPSGAEAVAAVRKLLAPAKP